MTDISGIVLCSADYTVFGNKRIHAFSWMQPGTDTFPSGGIQCPPSNFKLTKIDFVDIDGGDFVYHYDYANEKVDAYDFTAVASGIGAIALAGPVPTSGLFVRFRVQGTGLA